MTGEKVNIQSVVEAPSLYIVARSSSDEDQLCYVETSDKMTFFHGDSPTRQYEAGQQKGGNYYCAICGANAHRVCTS